MSSPSDIRRQFIEFFQERQHTFVPSAPVLPSNDPTLLFTNAGMNQFKDVFLEQGTRAYSRAVNSQKCIRVSGKHNDLEEVGPSPIHHTFFEMLGNWSFGDYYKVEAIRWAWELVTKVWGIDPQRLYPTVFIGSDEAGQDEEAYDAWVNETGADPDHISFHGRKDNFWEMGEVGPCGPCSELHYDLGPSFCHKQDVKDHHCAVNGDCGRIIELWNLVFIQYRRDTEGKLHPLPRRHVDTGAGLERFLMVMEGVRSNFETTLFAPLIAYIANLSGVDYHRDKRGIPHRVAADHVRALAFSLADGVLPSNEGRGYVLRRILRRAARFGREIGLEEPFLYKLVDPLVTTMGDHFTELKERSQHITGVIKAEEESFARTLGKGLEIFGGIVEKIHHQGTKTLRGEDAFKLYDTYGFPLDLTELMARERDLSVDVKRFQELMSQQREKARGEGKFVSGDLDLGEGLKTQFVGYDEREVEAEVLAVKAEQDGAAFVLDRTPFYVESGGQISDQGWLQWNGTRADVTKVVRVGDAVVHFVQAESKLPTVGQKLQACIDVEQRLPTEYNHTATHLLHTALRKYLGKHASQAGSLVAPDRLRFDFTHHEKPSPEVMIQIEKEVNRAIRADYPVRWYELPFKDIASRGITALFGEKYGEVVRVIHIGSDEAPYSRELCGGTHVRRTGELGLFRILTEGAVSAGVRRIEAITGEYALDYSLSEHRSLAAVAELISSHGSDPVDKLRKTLEDKKALEKDYERLLDNWARGIARELLDGSLQMDGARVAARNFESLEVDRLKLVGDALRAADSGVVALLTSPASNGSGQLCCVVGDALISGGMLKAGSLVSLAAKIAGGGGGGKPHMATAGTKHPDKLNEAISAFPSLVKEALKLA